MSSHHQPKLLHLLSRQPRDADNLHHRHPDVRKSLGHLGLTFRLAIRHEPGTIVEQPVALIRP